MVDLRNEFENYLRDREVLKSGLGESEYICGLKIFKSVKNSLKNIDDISCNKLPYRQEDRQDAMTRAGEILAIENHSLYEWAEARKKSQEMNDEKEEKKEKEEKYAPFSYAKSMKIYGEIAQFKQILVNYEDDGKKILVWSTIDDANETRKIGIRDQHFCLQLTDKKSNLVTNANGKIEQVCHLFKTLVPRGSTITKQIFFYQPLLGNGKKQLLFTTKDPKSGKKWSVFDNEVKDSYEYSSTYTF
jgi:hypothetical protein